MNDWDSQFIFGPDLNVGRDPSMLGKYRHGWVEENVVFTEKVGKQLPSPKGNSHIGSGLAPVRLVLFLSVILLVFTAIIARLIFLQIGQGGNFEALAERNRQRILPIPAERGLIFDRDNVQLTENIPSFALAVVPQDLPRNPDERAQVVKRLAELSNKDEKVVAEILLEYSAYSHESIVVQENIDYDTAIKLMIDAGNLPGIQIQRGSKRHYYNYNNVVTNASSTMFSLAHVLGYIGKLDPAELNKLYTLGYYPSDAVGKTGVEKFYETDLRGVYGRRRIEVNALGREQSVLAEEAPVPGKHLKLSIDLEMQNKLEEIINNSLTASNKKRAAGIAMNPNNGEILALVSLPAFDNNDFSGGISTENYERYINNKDHPLFNRAISGLYPSGSTIKPAIAASALQAGIITSASSFLSNGGLRIGAWFFPDWQAGGHGVTNVRRALAWSVNTFFYYIGGGFGDFHGLGVEKLIAFLKEFGFSEKLGIDLSGEQSGFLPSKNWKEETKKEQWYIGDTYNLSIGQGDILVTPLQIAEMTMAVANGGSLYVPHVVKSIINPVAKTESVIEPKLVREKYFKPDYLYTVRLGMRDCVEYGSCRLLGQLPFRVAGKTGTAQWNSDKENHAWFTSFAPFDNPQIVVTILVEEGGEGSSVSAPIAYEFYKWWSDR